MPMPVVAHGPIRIRFRPALTVHRGRLLSGTARGRSLNGGSFLRQRLIVLDEELLRQPPELTRILIHELFHFAWLRLGNAIRRSWEEALAREFHAKALGELGWSAQWRKAELAAKDRQARNRRWREYACESFCDTASWIYGGARSHEEFTLPGIFRRRRRRWFAEALGSRAIPI